MISFTLDFSVQKVNTTCKYFWNVNCALGPGRFHFSLKMFSKTTQNSPSPKYKQEIFCNGLSWLVFISYVLKKKLVEGQLTPVHVLLEWSALGVSHIHNCHILQVYIEASETELFWQKQDSGYHSHYWLGQYHANSQTLFSVQAQAALIDFGTRQPLSFILHVFQLEGCNES